MIKLEIQTLNQQTNPISSFKTTKEMIDTQANKTVELNKRLSKKEPDQI